VHYSGPSGKVIPIEINATVVGTGPLRRILTLCRDITDRLETERVLQNSQKLESLGILAGGIAHDFNNLLTGIFGYIDLAKTGLAKDSKAFSHINNALAVFERARALTRQLLTFSRGGSPSTKTVSISRILTDVVGFALSGSNVNAHFSLSDSLWSCNVDEHQVGQVIDNIVINARQAMPLGGSITLAARNIGEGEPVPPPLVPGRYVRISIADTGIGIPAEILPRIFDPFFTTKQQGSGLGLATAYSIVRKHNGHISAESQPGKGTTFTLFLPAALQETNETVVRETQECCGKGRRVLIMDDERFILDIGSTLLGMMGCETAAASTAEEAVRLFREATDSGIPFHLVILDLTIPGGEGGMETLRHLREIDPEIKAIASSGHSFDPIMADPSRYGFSAGLAKPYIKDEFRAIVVGLLK
jgi:nitrogen-specific signal transduction histidine kinase/CheY-like chemotaxis protein